MDVAVGESGAVGVEISANRDDDVEAGSDVASGSGVSAGSGSGVCAAGASDAVRSAERADDDAGASLPHARARVVISSISAAIAAIFIVTDPYVVSTVSVDSSASSSLGASANGSGTNWSAIAAMNAIRDSQ